jgi:hypothetical protein
MDTAAFLLGHPFVVQDLRDHVYISLIRSPLSSWIGSKYS